MTELEIKILLEALITEREGMIAENNICRLNEEYHPYDDKRFFYLAKQIKELRILARDSN